MDFGRQMHHRFGPRQHWREIIHRSQIAHRMRGDAFRQIRSV